MVAKTGWLMLVLVIHIGACRGQRLAVRAGSESLRTTVKTGPAAPGSGFVEVRDGLAAGDRVIVTEITAAQVGQKVLVRADSASASALTANR